MAHQAVEAVIFLRYNESTAKYVYGRPTNAPSFSKNYIQVSGEAEAVLDRVLGRGTSQEVDFEWKWPGDSLTATWKLKTSTGDRGELYIRNQDSGVTKSVRPFQLGDPSADIEITFKGQGGSMDGKVAEAAVNGFVGTNRGWLLAIKLAGEDGVLHARAYLDDQSASSKRTLEALPASVRAAILRLPNGRGAGAIEFGPSRRGDELAERIAGLLEHEPNVLLTGPPGTGKTVTLEALAANFLTATAPTFDPELWEDNWREPRKERKVVSLVFHPSYSYERFVGGLIPEVGAKAFSLAVKPGPLLNLAHWIGNSDREALLIIDEFNRGAPAAIFGDTLALLDASKRSEPFQAGPSILRPYAGHQVEVEAAYANATRGTKVDSELRLPVGLKIVAAMNSSDRSVAPLDAAMRRRFHIAYIGPDYEALSKALGISKPDASTAFVAASSPIGTWAPENVWELAVRLLMGLNGRIDAILGPDFLLGPALLWSVKGDTVEERVRSLAQQFQARVVASLKMTFVEQDEALALVLGVKGTGSGPVIAALRQPDSSLQSFASARLAWRDIEREFGWEDQVKALLQILPS